MVGSPRRGASVARSADTRPRPSPVAQTDDVESERTKDQDGSGSSGARSEIRTTLGSVYPYEQGGHVHQLMGDGALPEGNVSVLINATKEGLTDLP